MDTLNTEIKEKILDLLRNSEIGASSSEIAKSIGHNRITVSKYLEIMKAHKLIEYKDVAQAKLWALANRNNKSKILVVDDEPHIVNLIKLSLNPQFKTFEAFTGLDALDQIYSNMPDLIILDLMMPGMNGYEVCQKVKENALTQHIPVMILSAKSDMKDKIAGINVGADDYVTKPFDPAELVARAELLIRSTDKKQEFNPLTNLQGRDAVSRELDRWIKKNQPFSITLFNIKNFRSFNEKYGFKKGDEVLKLVARLLTQKLEEAGCKNYVCGHPESDKFILVTNSKKQFSKKIALEFNKLVPYLYHDEEFSRLKNKIYLKSKRVSSRDIKTINLLKINI